MEDARVDDSRCSMQLINLDQTKVIESAQQAFQNYYIAMDTADVYVRDIEEGEIQMDGIDHPLYVRTHYVYEDHLVNGNKTRYKIQVTTIRLKKSRYDVIYDSTKVYYVAYEEDGIHFVRYDQFQDFLVDKIHVIT